MATSYLILLLLLSHLEDQNQYRLHRRNGFEFKAGYGRPGDINSAVSGLNAGWHMIISAMSHSMESVVAIGHKVFDSAETGIFFEVTLRRRVFRPPSREWRQTNEISLNPATQQQHHREKDIRSFVPTPVLPHRREYLPLLNISRINDHTPYPVESSRLMGSRKRACTWWGS